MGRKSGKTNKSIYLQCREDAGLTRFEASEKLGYISESRLEKLETGKTPAQPEDITAMAEAYGRPDLCNYYCVHECAIGRDHVPEVKLKGLSQIVLGMLASLNTLDKEKERLIEITADEVIDEDELTDFVYIQEQLEKIQLTVESLKLWINRTIASGGIDKDKLEEVRKKISG